VRLDHVGLNHLTWERAVYLDDENVLPRLLADHAGEVAADLDLPADFIRRLGAIPSYYLRYYYEHDNVVTANQGKPTRAEVVADVERQLLDMYADKSLDTKPELLEKRGGAYYSEAAVQLISSLYRDTKDTQVVNVRNAGTMPFLSDDAVIEVPAVVGAGGAEPLPVAPVEPLFAGLIAHVSAYEELAVAAALHGGRDRVFDALLAHPLVGQLDVASALTDRLLAENAKFLPWAAGA
jgi:6-phospho-beta-glucosidase